jgi:signal transduction histidine kinase
MLARPALEFVHPDDLAASTAAWSAVFRTGSVDHFVARTRRADGHYLWLEWTATLGPDGSIYAVARDITDRLRAEAELARAMEDLERRNRELQDFAFVASHDLQEPLRKIQAFGDRLGDRPGLDEQGRDYVQRMRHAASRMQTLIDDLLAYSRVTTRAQPFVEFALDQVLDEVLGDLETAVEAAGARIDRRPLPRLVGDPVQLRQVLQNLLSNALKFRAADRPCVVRVRGDEFLRDGGRWVRIEVEDEGIGFDPRYREKIFAPFHRLHGRSEYAGTGIGLAIVRKIVERHGGRIEARGIPGTGATFTIELPADPRGQPDAPAPAIVADGF